MKDRVLVSVSGTQFYFNDGETSQPVEVVTPGTYEKVGDDHLIRYVEAYEGTDSTTTNEIRILPDSVLISKEGVVSTNMVFAEGKKGITYYTTPFGTIEMGISTTELRREIGKDRIELDIGYALSMNGDHVADCRVRIDASSN